MKSEDLERIKSIKRRHEKHWLALDGVVAVGVGGTSSGKVGLIVSVKKNAAQLRKSIPEEVEGTLIEIRETGEIAAL